MSVKRFTVSLVAIFVAAAIGIFVALQFYAAADVFLTVGLVSAGVIVVALVARFAPGARSGSGAGGWRSSTYGDGGWGGGDGGGWSGGDGGGGGCGGGSG